MSINHTQNPYMEKIKSIILAKIEGHSISVYLFGSRANNTARQRSDVDVALFSPSKPLPPFLLSEIKDELVSDVPYQVDLVDLNNCDEVFRKKVIAEGILWRD